MPEPVRVSMGMGRYVGMILAIIILIVVLAGVAIFLFYSKL